MKKSEIIFLRKVFKRNLLYNSFAYYLKIGILHNILKDLREIFNISRIKKYFHFFHYFSGQSLHSLPTYFNQNKKPKRLENSQLLRKS